MNRFKWWAMLVFSSTLVCASLAYKFWINGNNFEKREIVILCLYAPTIVLSLAGVFTSMFWNGKIKAWTETILIMVNLIFWIVIAIATLIGADVARLQDIENLVVQTGVITEPNLYFFSFGSFFNSVYLASSWFKQYILLDENALTTTQWTFLATSGFVVMMTGISLYDESSCEVESAFSCSRTIFSIFVGLLSGVTSCILIPWRSAPLKCQGEFALILFVTWAAAIAILTFDTGPAVSTNTMYFGTYLSFFLALNILNTTTYADAVLETSPYSHVEFGRTDSERDEDAIGAAGFLDFAYANIKKSQEANLSDDPRNADKDEARLFDSVGGSLKSLIVRDDNRVSFSSSSQLGRETQFNKKVVVGKRDLNRIEIWFILLVESLVCIVVFYNLKDASNSIFEQWMILAPAISIVLSCIGWVISTIKRRWAYIIEGVLILSCIMIWIRDLVAVTFYFRDTTSDQGGMQDMKANQLFMSYGAFFTSLYLVTEWSNASVTTTDWVFLSAASATIFGVIFITHDDIFKECPWMSDFRICGELQLVTILSLGSAVVSFVMVFVTFIKSCEKVMHIVHVAIGTTLLCLWGVGSYFIVFESTGFGAEIGPTFFACWASLFFCVDIATTNLVLLCKNRTNEGDDDDADSNSSISSHDRNERFEDEEDKQRLSLFDGSIDGGDHESSNA